MTCFQRCCCGVTIMAAAAAPVEAGPNGGGTIFVHDAGLAYSVDTASYCGLGAAPASCQGADVRIDGALAGAPKVFKAYAAFIPGTSPRFKGIAFGVHYDENDWLGPDFPTCDPNPCQATPVREST